MYLNYRARVRIYSPTFSGKDSNPSQWDTRRGVEVGYLAMRLHVIQLCSTALLYSTALHTKKVIAIFVFHHSTQPWRHFMNFKKCLPC